MKRIFNIAKLISLVFLIGIAENGAANGMCQKSPKCNRGYHCSTRPEKRGQSELKALCGFEGKVLCLGR